VSSDQFAFRPTDSTSPYFLHLKSKLLKYVDDTYLIVPVVVSHIVEQELNHIADWSRANNLRLNQSQEIIFTAPTAHRRIPSALPDPIQGIKRLSSIKVLGVIVNDQLTTSDHVTEQHMLELRTVIRNMNSASICPSYCLSKPDYCIAPQLGQVSVPQPTARV